MVVAVVPGWTAPAPSLGTMSPGRPLGARVQKTLDTPPVSADSIRTDRHRHKQTSRMMCLTYYCAALPPLAEADIQQSLICAIFPEPVWVTRPSICHAKPASVVLCVRNPSAHTYRQQNKSQRSSQSVRAHPQAKLAVVHKPHRHQDALSAE